MATLYLAQQTKLFFQRLDAVVVVVGRWNSQDQNQNSPSEKSRHLPFLFPIFLNFRKPNSFIN